MFGIEIEPLIRAIGVIGIMTIIFAETGLLVGFFLPGDTLLFAAGILTHQGVLGVNIHLLVGLLIVAAVIGNTLGYYIGKKFGPRVFKKPDALFFSHENVRRAEKFYEKYGPITIVLARFTPVVRTFAPVVAGVGNMDMKKFQLYNVIGATLWIASITYLGYYGGAWLEANGINVDALVMPVILAAVLFTLLSPLVHIIRDKEARDIFLKKLGIKKD
jgi:membrane-associated protein